MVGCGESNYDVFGGTDQPNEETVTVPPTEIVYENGEEDDDGVSEESDRGMDSDFVLDKVRSMAGISITRFVYMKEYASNQSRIQCSKSRTVAEISYSG